MSQILLSLTGVQMLFKIDKRNHVTCLHQWWSLKGRGKCYSSLDWCGHARGQVFLWRCSLCLRGGKHKFCSLATTGWGHSSGQIYQPNRTETQATSCYPDALPGLISAKSLTSPQSSTTVTPTPPKSQWTSVWRSSCLWPDPISWQKNPNKRKFSSHDLIWFISCTAWVSCQKTPPYLTSSK